MKLIDAMNTYNPALLVLREKGYKIGLLVSDEEDKLGDWYAIKEGNEFKASDPLRLLGLISIYDVRGSEWRRTNGDIDLYNSIVSSAFEDEQ